MIDEHQDLTLSTGKQNYVLVADQQGLRVLAPLLEAIRDIGSPYEGPLLEEELQDRFDHVVDSILGRQKVGSYLYVAGSRRLVQKVCRIAYASGFTDGDMQVKVTDGSFRIFCSRCYMITERVDFSVFICDSCGLKLEPSTHYSRYHDAYLGYPVLGGDSHA
ncbi:MAG: hypothetical protein H0Z33_03305 [Bacillaceae bacterium]|nr:hypothetical protein [Bacillaceae bacterium]